MHSHSCNKLFYSGKTAGFCLKSHTLLVIGPLIQPLLCLYCMCIVCSVSRPFSLLALSLPLSLRGLDFLTRLQVDKHSMNVCVISFVMNKLLNKLNKINMITMLGLNLSTSLCSKQITLALGKAVSLMQFSSTVMKPVSNTDTAIQLHSTDSSVIKYPYCRALKTECG